MIADGLDAPDTADAPREMTRIQEWHTTQPGGDRSR